MNATTVAVDLAKTVFELAISDEQGRLVERKRLSREGFAQFFINWQILSVPVRDGCLRRLAPLGTDVPGPGSRGQAVATPACAALCPPQ